jgi:DNA-binding transcriptional regulator YiaG
MNSRELKSLRKRLGVSQAKLAKGLGVTENTVARWERGEVPISEPLSRLLRIIVGDEVPEIKFVGTKPKKTKKRGRKK